MVGSRLNLKLIRDLKTSPLMFGGIMLLVLVGITLFVASYELYLNLESSYALSYKKLKLADFTVPVQSAPEEVLNTLSGIPGVEVVQGRTIRDVEIEQPESVSRKVVGRLISLPNFGKPRINQLKVLSGSYPKRDASREVLLESSFAKYHGYTPGDSLEIVVLGENLRFRVTGIVQSPEYIYVVSGGGYPMPNPRSFGVMWMRGAMVDKLFGTSGSINDIGVLMAGGGNRNTAMRLAAKTLRPYGADDPIPQENQPSVELLRLDIMGLQSLAVFFPILFLTISGLSVYNLLSRMVRSQRSQIGFLRAVGFSKNAVLKHYLGFSLVVGGVGGFVGAILGHLAGIWVTKFYSQFVQVPYYDVTPRWAVVAVGLGCSALVTVVAGFAPALAAAKLPPAQAIGAEAPTTGRHAALERHLPFLRKLPLISRLPLRNFVRNLRRTFSTVAGVASAATLLLVASALLDSSVASINFYFEHILHYDVMASYMYPHSESAANQIRTWKGVRRVEPVLVMPAKLVKGDADQTVLIYGVRSEDRLFSMVNRAGETVPLEVSGIMVADSTVKKLGLWKGGNVRLTLPAETVPELAEAGVGSVTIGVLPADRLLYRQSFSQGVLSSSRALLETQMDHLVRVSGVTYQPFGGTAYADIEQVRRWYGRPLELPPSAISGVAIEVEPRYIGEVERKLYDLDGVGSVEVISYIEEEIGELLKSSQTFFNVMLAFAIGLAAVIMFNSTLMNVIERTREIATLRTIGLSTRTTAMLIAAENLLAYLCGIAIGVPFGVWLANTFVQMYESESLSMQTVIFPRTYWFAILGILATVVLAQIPGIQYIRKIQLAKATKDVG